MVSPNDLTMCPTFWLGGVGVRGSSQRPACIAQPSMYAGLLPFAALLRDYTTEELTWVSFRCRAG